MRTDNIPASGIVRIVLNTAANHNNVVTADRNAPYTLKNVESNDRYNWSVKMA